MTLHGWWVVRMGAVTLAAGALVLRIAGAW